MKRFAIVLISVSCFLSSHSQNLFTQQRNITNYFSGIIEDESGGYVFMKSNEGPYQYPLAGNTQILKISASGQLLDSAVFEPGFVSTLRPIFLENNYYVFGTKFKYDVSNNNALICVSEIIKLNAALDVIEVVKIDSVYNSYAGATNIVYLQNRLYVAILSISGSSGLRLYKFDLNFKKSDSLFISEYVVDMARYQGHLILASSSNGSSPYHHVTEIDTSLNLLSQFSLQYLDPNAPCGMNVGMTENISLLGISDTNYVVSGEVVYSSGNCLAIERKMMTLSVKNNSTVLWKDTFGVAGRDNLAYFTGQFCSLVDNSAYTVGYSIRHLLPSAQPRNETTSFFIHKTDLAGNRQFFKNYTYPGMYYLPLSICATSDGGAVISGLRYDTINPKVPGSGEGFVTKIDQNGIEQFVGILENGGFNANYHRSFPNPTSHEIYFEVPTQQNLKLTINDALGREITSIEKYANLSSLNISGFKPGIYFYELRSETKRFTGKFVKE